MGKINFVRHSIAVLNGKDVPRGDTPEPRVSSSAHSPLEACSVAACGGGCIYVLYKACDHVLVDTSGHHIFQLEGNVEEGLLQRIIRNYQENIRPELIKRFGNFCRFTPSCSNFALEAINRYGEFRGGILAAGRLVRCNPFSEGGFDPVP